MNVVQLLNSYVVGLINKNCFKGAVYNTICITAVIFKFTPTLLPYVEKYTGQKKLRIMIVE